MESVTKAIAATMAIASLGVGVPALGQEPMGKLAAGLLDQAEAEGVVRVIVTTGTAAEAPAANTAAAQVQVMNSLPPAHVSLAEPLGDAQVLMEVTEEGLRALENSPLVVRVQLDALDAPQSGGLDAPQSGGPDAPSVSPNEPQSDDATGPEPGREGVDAPSAADDADAPPHLDH